MRSINPFDNAAPPLRVAASIFLVLSLLNLTGGCASTARDLGAAAAPAALRAGLYESNQPDDQAQINRFADSPAFQHAGIAVGEGVGIGLFNQANKFASGDTGAFDRSTTRPATGPTTKPGAAAVMSFAGGGINGFVKSSVQEAFLAATDPQFKAGEEAMSEAIGEGFVSGMIKVLNSKGPELGETIRKQLGPIVQELIREQIAPAVRDMLQQQLAPAALQVWREGAVETLKLTVRPDLQPDVQQNAQNISVGAAHGTHQVFVENGVLTQSGDLTPRLKSYAVLATGALGVILFAMFTLLIMLNLIALHYWRHRHADRHASPAGHSSKPEPRL